MSDMSESTMSKRTMRTRSAGAGAPARLALPALLALLPLPLIIALPALAAAPAPAQAPAPAPAPATAPTAAPAPGIAGDYLEARTADVYTGPCFANSEMDLVGKQAVVAWHVREGAWQGVPLGGLSVAAAVRSSATLGDPFAGPLHAAALIVVDQRATPPQRDALVAFAHAMSGDLLATVVAVESAPIEMTVAGDSGDPAEHPGHHHLAAGLAVAGISGDAHLKAGAWIDLATRGIGPKDHLCGNEEVFYPPLTADHSRVTAVPAVTVAYDFRGPGLGMVWSSPGKRSAFVGRFAH
jgi:hypothetical protein